MKSMNETTTPSDMTAWEMATSILTGLRQAEAQARKEYDKIITSNPNKPFVPGLALAHDVLNSISKAKNDFEFDLRRMARSSGLTMPADDAGTK